jgi:hypothetical protein
LVLMGVTYALSPTRLLLLLLLTLLLLMLLL